MIPKRGSLERVFLEALIQHPEGVTFLDLVGTGITEDNIEQVAQNLRTGMYESDFDELLRKDDE